MYIYSILQYLLENDTVSTRLTNKRQVLRNDFTFRSGSTVVIKNVYPPPMMEHQTGEWIFTLDKLSSP